MYEKAFAGQAGIAKLPFNSADRKNAYWWYPIILDIDKLNIEAPEFLKRLQAKKVPCYGIQWPEAYEEKAYREKQGFGSANFPFQSTEYTRESLDYTKILCPVAKLLRAKTICLFLHPTWEKEHIQYCIDKVMEVLAAAR